MLNVATEVEAAARAYLDAFEKRDLGRCMEFYRDDATLLFQSAAYRGRAAIEGWHRERFGADLRLTRLERLTVNGAQVVIDATAVSNRLKAWKIASIGGRVTLTFEDGRIREAKLTARMGPLDLLG
jgi:hypothetical protein